MSKEDFLNKIAGLIIANREEEVQFEVPEPEIVQQLVLAALASVRYARFGIDVEKNLTLADRYLSLARGDMEALEEQEEQEEESDD